MYNNKKVGIGISTYERPEFFVRALRSVMETLPDLVDVVVACDDGSSDASFAIKQEAFTPLTVAHPWISMQLVRQENAGVASVKNHCLQHMMNMGCDYLFLMEDDMSIVDTRAVTGYIDTSERSRVGHFNFAHHGPMNEGGPVGEADLIPSEIIDGVEVYVACVGAWSFYTRQCIEDVGLMDETFVNAWEHCDHTARCAKAGYTFRFWRFPDVAGSKEWIVPQDNSLYSSKIREDPNWWARTQKLKEYWVSKDPTIW